MRKSYRFEHNFGPSRRNVGSDSEEILGFLNIELIWQGADVREARTDCGRAVLVPAVCQGLVGV